MGLILAASRVFPGHPDIHMGLWTFDRIPEGEAIVARWLPQRLLRRHGIGELRVRTSGLDCEQRASYLSNGCVSCGAMQTLWFVDKVFLDDPETALSVPVTFERSLADGLPGTRDWRLWWFDES